MKFCYLTDTFVIERVSKLLLNKLFSRSITKVTSNSVFNLSLASVFN